MPSTYAGSVPSPAADERLHEILELLRADGGRVTSARRAVVTSLMASDGHVSAEAIAAEVQAAMPDVSVSTVYRTLEVLERLGQVEHVHLGHGPSLYHLADRRHVHLLCRVCDQVIELPHTYLAGLSDQLVADHGFVLEPGHFALLGTCAPCAASAEQAG